MAAPCRLPDDHLLSMCGTFTPRELAEEIVRLRAKIADLAAPDAPGWDTTDQAFPGKGKTLAEIFGDEYDAQNGKLLIDVLYRP